MRSQLMLTSCLVVGTQAFAPAPLRWGGHLAEKLVLTPSWTSVPPHNLMIRDGADGISRGAVSLFTAQPDKTITWDNLAGWCVEASGKSLGDPVRVSTCNGESAQKWNWVSNGYGGEMIQLKDTNMCLDVVGMQGGFDGAPVELQRCDYKSTESWRFDDPVTIPLGSGSMRHALFGFIFAASLGVVGLSGWLWRKRVRPVIMSRDGLLLHADQGGVSLQSFDGEATTSLATNMATATRPKPSTGTRNQSPETSIPRLHQAIETRAPPPRMIDVDENFLVVVGTLLASTGVGFALSASTKNAGERNEQVVNDQVCVECKGKKVVDCTVCQGTGVDEYASIAAAVRKNSGAPEESSAKQVVVEDWEEGQKAVVMYEDILKDYPPKATESVCSLCEGRGIVVCGNCDGSGLQPRFLERYSPDDFMD